MSERTLMTVVGARPQFIKAAAVSRALRTRQKKNAPWIRETLVHTGQHYDPDMSQVFFDELELDKPQIHLDIGSGPHGMQTGRMLEQLEQVFLKARPGGVLVYGDTNSTLAGAIAASKQHIPVYHVEAGLRSWRRDMPEEINRVLTDHVSSLHLCPTPKAVDNLRNEGITEGVRLVGDVMFDSLRHYLARTEGRMDQLKALGLEPGNFILTTLHRAENTDTPERLDALVQGLAAMSRKVPVVLVMHPRTKSKLAGQSMAFPASVQTVAPVSYLNMLQLMRHAMGVATDSGGLQKEAYFLSRPCLTLRDETEWTETVDNGANTLAGCDQEKMLDWVERLASGAFSVSHDTQPFGDGNASEKILEAILNALAGKDGRF